MSDRGSRNTPTRGLSTLSVRAPDLCGSGHIRFRRICICGPEPDHGAVKGGETMPTTKKAQTIDELTDQLDKAKLAILTDYRGLTVSDLQGLRGTLRPLGAEFRIAKNTLTKIAADRAGITGLDPALEGPL